jgi:hypothetical protein
MLRQWPNTASKVDGAVHHFALLKAFAGTFYLAADYSLTPQF